MMYRDVKMGSNQWANLSRHRFEHVMLHKFLFL